MKKRSYKGVSDPSDTVTVNESPAATEATTEANGPPVDAEYAFRPGVRRDGSPKARPTYANYLVIGHTDDRSNPQLLAVLPTIGRARKWLVDVDAILRSSFVSIDVYKARPVSIHKLMGVE